MRFKHVLALIPAMLCGFSASAIEKIGEVYQIGSANDMTAFAEIVNGGETGAQAVLTADIDWTSGSTMLEAFTGVLDGQGHSLKMNLEGSEDYSAFIRSLAGTVENLVLEGKFVLSGLFGAGFAGQTWDGATLRNCVSKIEFDVREAGFGSFIGTTNAPIVIENCVTAGTIKVLPEVTAFGGFIGATGPVSYLLLRRCLMLADVECTSAPGQWGTYVFTRFAGACEECYYTSAFCEQANGAAPVDKAQVASGELCWKLNQGLESPAFYQTLDADAIPYPMAEGHKPIYVNAHANCAGQITEVFGFNNEKEVIRQDEHTMQNGTCTVCGYSDPNFFSANADGFYEIDNALKLYWFASLTSSEPGAKALLTADIDYTEYNTMLGEKTPFSGVLNGQGHSITVRISGGEDGANYVAFVRELDGGTIENLVLEGEVASASLFAGGIVGHTMNAAVLRNVVSRVSLSQIGEGGVAAFGGFVGHIQDGLIENCIFAGSIRTVGNSTSGVTGWADNLEMHNCAVIADIEVGDLTACFADSRGANIVQDNFYYKTALGGCCFPATQVTDEQIQSGELCHLLNGLRPVPIFYQTLNLDTHPVPFPDHGIVLPVYASEGTKFVCASADSEAADCANALYSGEMNFVSSVLCSTQARTDYETSVDETLNNISTRESLWAAYLLLMEKKQAVKNSIEAYQTYADAVENAKNYVKEHASELEGAYFEKLQQYLETSGEPSADFPHGTSLYIMEERQLNDEEIRAEAEYVGQLLQMAIENGYTAGAEITSLLRNPKLADGTNGWQTEGSVAVSSGLGVVQGCFSMDQQVEGIQKEGIYAFTFDGRYKGDVEGNNFHFASYIFANDVCNYVVMPGEKEDGSEGLFRNVVVANVTGGQLKVGVETVGQSAYKETVISNFRLVYLGTPDEASEALNEVVASMKLHAETMLNRYEYLLQNYFDGPNFSQALKDELQALTAEEPSTGLEKYNLICKYSDIFRRIFECKQAYAKMMYFVDRMYDELYALAENNLIPETEKKEYEQRLDGMDMAYADGLYSAAEAEENCQWEIKVDLGLPQVDGICQISTAEQMAHFCRLVDSGFNKLHAQLVADIDFSEHNTMLGGGMAFSGVLDGQGHSLTVNISAGEDGANYVAFVRELDGGTVENLVLEGNVASASLFAGGIVGHTMNAAVLRNVVSRVNLSQIGVAGVAAFGGFVGHIQDGLIENCIFAGSIHTVGNSTSGVTGWADNLEMHNCAVIADIEVGDLTECYAGPRGANVVQDNFYYKTPLLGSVFPATQVTDEQIQNGELCYMLNGDQSKIQWTQLLGEEKHPMPFYRDEAVVLRNDDNTYGNASGVAAVATDRPCETAVYDMLGRKVAEVNDGFVGRLCKGIYVIKGKKMLVK
ncbi:MAG: hypothetical protein K5945_08920 [Bacteroidaceae bacterium]|nr:hypothetical protein [Bacteroidaceae bacterium]